MREQSWIEHNIIILSRQTLDEFLKHRDPSSLIALYCFYYYTAKWQKTNQPKATTKYCQQALHWGADKVRNTKHELIKLGLVEDVRDTDEKGKVRGWYIKVNYLWKQETHTPPPPEGGSSHRVVFREGNALSADREREEREKNSLAKTSFAKEIPEIIYLFKEVNPSIEKYYKNTTQRGAVDRMLKVYGRGSLEEIIRALPEINKKQYWPKSTTPLQLENNIPIYMAKSKEKGQNLGVVKV